MKVNKFGMLIKFSAFYFCINFIVATSAIPLDDKKSDKHATSVEVIDDYDATSYEKSTEGSTNDTKKPPFVFPTDDNKSLKNDTALEILQKNSNLSIINEENSTGKEVKNKDVNVEKNDQDYDDKEKQNDKDKGTEKTQKDKQKSPKTEEVNKSKNEQETKDKDYDVESSHENSDDDKEETENIQESQDQGDLEERYGVNSTSINVFEEPTLKGRHIAFIFATSLVFLSATAYVGLVIWRKTLERRYGMRQRLVTEDDYYNNNDVRFFGL